MSLWIDSKQAFNKLYYQCLYYVLPLWLRIELEMSWSCKKHYCIARCDCYETQRRLSLGGTISRHLKDIERLNIELSQKDATIFKLEQERIELLRSVFEWKAAFQNQQTKNTNTYWEGCRSGRKSAIEWHTHQAQLRLNNKAKYVSAEMQNGCELDARMHTWSAEQIKDLGKDN